MKKGGSKVSLKRFTKFVIFAVFVCWTGFFCQFLNAAVLTYYRYYIVRKGDSLWEIGRQYNVTVTEIKKKNNLRTSKIYPGQKLIIPVKVKGVYHTVKKHETLWRICKTYKVSMEEVISLNRLSDPDHIVAGQRIFIPGATQVKEVKIPEEIISGGKKAPVTPEEEKEVIKFSPSQKETLKEKGILIWPVDQKVKPQEYRKSEFGIDIIAPEGTTIVAPARGKVYYSGLLRNYGWTIIIEHQEIGIYTCYMYNMVNLVEKGDVVEQGEPIAKVGKSGAGEAMLHFEVRRAKDGKPVDPLDFLSSESKLN